MRTRPVRARKAFKLLIVDDERDLLETLRMRFEGTGRFVVETAVDGEAGLELVRSFRPDVVLVDLLMPRVDGWEFCRRLRCDPDTRLLPIVVMTAIQEPQTQAWAHVEGIHRVLIKPFNPPVLVQALLDALPPS